MTQEFLNSLRRKVCGRVAFCSLARISKETLCPVKISKFSVLGKVFESDQLLHLRKELSAVGKASCRPLFSGQSFQLFAAFEVVKIETHGFPCLADLPVLDILPGFEEV